MQGANEYLVERIILCLELENLRIPLEILPMLVWTSDTTMDVSHPVHGLYTP